MFDTFKKQLLLMAVTVLLCTQQGGEASFWPKVSNINEGICVFQNTKLLSLLNLLCNATQTASVQMRDACYGCFFRAGTTMEGPSQLYSLSDCARLYIQQSNYSTCATNLQAIVDGNRPIPEAAPMPGALCYTGYCEFVRCVRRINTQQLITSCYREAMGSRDLTAPTDQIYFFTNMTSCILAKTRCSQYNPITGELQNPLVRPPLPGGPTNIGALPLLGSMSPAVFNALHISDTGDIRILAFPTVTIGVTDPFCAGPPPLLQSGFSTYLC